MSNFPPRAMTVGWALKGGVGQPAQGGLGFAEPASLQDEFKNGVFSDPCQTEPPRDSIVARTARESLVSTGSAAVVNGRSSCGARAGRFNRYFVHGEMLTQGSTWLRSLPGVRIPPRWTWVATRKRGQGDSSRLSRS